MTVMLTLSAVLTDIADSSCWLSWLGTTVFCSRFFQIL